MLKAHPLLAHSLEGLKSGDQGLRITAAKQLRACVLAAMRDGATESFAKFLKELNRRIFELVSSPDANHTIGGILAIDELIDVPLEQNDKIIRFANYLRMVFSSNKLASGASSMETSSSTSQTEKKDQNTSLALRLAARALGHLARSGGSLTVDFVEFEVTRALEWLQSERFENRRLAAVLVLKELAENAPTLFYVHIQTFFTHVWAALRDPNVEIRVCATYALAACLNLIMDRESRLRIRWYYGVYETAQAGLRSNNHRERHRKNRKYRNSRSSKQNSTDINGTNSIHGSLLAIGQLLVSTGDFIIPRFSEICDTIIYHKDHKDMLIKRTVVALLPALAEISPFAFVEGGYLGVVLEHLLDLVVKSDTRGDAFLSLGKLAVAVGSKIEPQLTKIIPLLQDGLSPTSKRGFCSEALRCTSALARAVGPSLQVYMDDLLEQMFANGLSEALASALSEIGIHIPLFLPLLQARVMQEVSLILSGEPYMDPGSEGFDSLFIPTRALDFRLASVRDKIANGQKQNMNGKGGMQGSKNKRNAVGGAMGNQHNNHIDRKTANSSLGEYEINRTSVPGQSSTRDLKELSRQAMQKIRAAQEKRAKLRMSHFGTIRGGLHASGKGGENSNLGLGERLLSKTGRSKNNLVTQSATSIYHSQQRKQNKKKKKNDALLDLTSMDDQNRLGLGVGMHANMGIPLREDEITGMLPGLLPCEDPAHVTLVLRVLATFDMTGMQLLPFVHDIVALYLDDPDPAIRKQAVQTCTAVISQYTKPDVSPHRGPTAWLRCKVLDRVLQIAVADHDSIIRSAAITALTPEFDPDLAQAEMLRSLFIALNDEMFEIREKTIAVIGRITTRNPAYIMPSLRKTLIRLLTELEYSSDSRGREQSSQLLCHLIRASKRLVKPYATPILKVLKPRLRDAHPGVATSVLRTLGELSLVGGEDLVPHLDSLLPTITEVIQDLGSELKRTTALRTLGQLIRSTGAVVTPYYQYKSLLGNILAEITMGEAANTPWSLRKEVIRTLGILGALDPYIHRQNVARRRRMLIFEEDLDSGGSDSSDVDESDAYKRTVRTGRNNNGIRKRRKQHKRRNSYNLNRVESRSKRRKSQSRGHGINNDGLGLERDRDVEMFGASVGVGFGVNGGPGMNYLNFDMMNEGRGTVEGARLAAGGLKDPIYGYFGMSAEEYNSYGLGDAETAKHAVDEIAAVLQEVEGPSHELYYPCVAINALVRVLRDPSLSTHHSLVAQAIMFIFRSLGLKCVPFLPQIVPTFIYVMNRCEHGLRESFFQQLGHLVGIVRQHIRPYLPHTFHMILKYWHESTEQILSLVEELSLALNDEFKKCLPKLTPLLILVLGHGHSDHRSSAGSAMPIAATSAQHNSKRGVGIRGRGAKMRYMNKASIDDLKSSIARGISRIGVTSNSQHIATSQSNYDQGDHTHHDRLIGGPLGSEAEGFLDIRPGESKTLYRMRLARASKNTLKALRTLTVLGANLSDQVHLIVPSVLSLLERDSVSVSVKAQAILSLTRLCSVLNFSDYASRMVHSFSRLLENITSDGRGGIVVQSINNGNDTDLIESLSVLGSVKQPESAVDRGRMDGIDSPKSSNNHKGVTGMGVNNVSSDHNTHNRLMYNRVLVQPAMECLCALARQLGVGFAIFAPALSRTLERSNIVHEGFRECVGRLVNNSYNREAMEFGTYAGAAKHNNSNLHNVKGDASFQWGEGMDALHANNDHHKPPMDRPAGVAKLHVTQTNLQRAWTTRQRSTREDWLEWMRRLSVELLRESPDPALRSCASFAQVYHPLARELFNAAFLSCWVELKPDYRQYLVNALLSALNSPNIPPEILQALLNLAEYMEHDDKALPIDISQLSVLATKCHAYAKALHYKELESASAEEPHLCTESLISINNKLGQPDAAKGILVHARQQAMQQGRHIHMEVNWFEKLGQWDDALKIYASKLRQTPNDINLMIGRMRCLQAIQEWEELAQQAALAWNILEPQARAEQLQEAKEEQAKASRAPRPSVTDSEDMLRFDTVSSNFPSRANSSSNFPSSDAKNIDSTSIAGSRESHELGPGTSNSSNFNTASSIRQATPSISLRQASARKQLQKVALMGAQSSWYLDKWDDMNLYVGATEEGEPNGALYRVITSIHDGNYKAAKYFINQSRLLIDKTLSALVGESYHRAYKQIVVVQMLSELEEILVYKKLQKAAEDTDSAELRADAAAYLDHLKKMWTTRLHGCQRSVDVWLRILSVRSLVLTPKEDLYTYIEFARICRKDSRRSQLSGKILMALGWKVPERFLRLEAENAYRVREGSSAVTDIKINLPNGMSMADQRLPELQEISRDLYARQSQLQGKMEDQTQDCHPRVLFSGLEDLWHSNPDVRIRKNILLELETLVNEVPYVSENTDLLVRCQMRIGHWTLNLHDIEVNLDEKVMTTALNAFEIATQLDPMYFKAWHAWALMNFRVVKIYERLCGGNKLAIDSIREMERKKNYASQNTNSDEASIDDAEPREKPTKRKSEIFDMDDGKSLPSYTKKISPSARVAKHLVPAIQSFFNSVSVTLQQRRQRHRLVSNVLQDMLRLITLWFDYGELEMVNAAMREGFQMLSVDNWLYVIPQLIARIHTKEPHVHNLLHQLLCDIGRKHPQALIYPLTVAAHSDHPTRKSAAQAVLSRMREQSATLVDQAALVSSELIRVAILWHEMWHEGLEEASRLYFGQHDVEGMMEVIEPLYKMMEKGAETIREISFHQAFWREISEAYAYLQKFKKYGKEADMNQAWDLFYHVFRRINKQLPQLTTLGLQYVSPKLLEARNLELAVPGTYFSYDWIEDDSLWEDGLSFQADTTSNTSIFTTNAEAFAAIAANFNHSGSETDWEKHRLSKNKYTALGLVGASGTSKEHSTYSTSGIGVSAMQKNENQAGDNIDGPEDKLSAEEEADLVAAARDEVRRKTSTMGVSRREVRIQSFVPSIAVITSKQRPRKILIRGSNGDEHTFLLKGHEDLRQDERVMQLFGLTNALLANHRDTSKRDLAIRRYAVIPLSPNCGIIGWVPHCDTLHQLIREFREHRKVRLSIEHMLMQQMAPDYERCTLMQKVEVFKFALNNTDGLDLQKVLWLKSRNSEVWLDRRTNFTRSLAVMSMVGYILGLGDRHPSNLMLDRVSGKIIHIDFGDCFEVAMQRDKYPEKIPFRLTRMLVNAMEVSGIEGNYRSVCEVVMRVLREQRDSVMAMLEAFVHDPLVNWGLIEKEQHAKTTKKSISKTKKDDKPVHPRVSGNNKLPPSSVPAVNHRQSSAPLDTVGEEDESVDDNEEEKPAQEEVLKTKEYSDSSSVSVKSSTEKSNNSMMASNACTDAESTVQLTPQSRTIAMPSPTPKKKKGLRKVKRASHKLSAMGGIKLPTVHDAIAKGDDRLAMKLSTSGMAQSLSTRSRSMRASYRGNKSIDRSNGSVAERSNDKKLDMDMKKSSGLLNQKAITVTARVRDKLTGKDFGNETPLDARTQVNRLILQATSHDNLSQCYIGWCPFW